jgi:hypothetical protein
MINIRNFTDKTADIIVGYLDASPSPFNEMEEPHAKNTRHHFRAIWEGVIWESNLRAEREDGDLFLRQIFYSGSKMKSNLTV